MIEKKNLKKQFFIKTEINNIKEDIKEFPTSVLDQHVGRYYTNSFYIYENKQKDKNFMNTEILIKNISKTITKINFDHLLKFC